MKPDLPRVLVIYTGGTFGMAPGLDVPDLSPRLLREQLLARVPELISLARCQVDIAMNCDSSHIGPDQWSALARRIRRKWERYDGVVVLHGTDTLPYTASALSFLLRPCRRPVVITGAQKPLAAIRTDARRNLISAVEIAAHGPRPFVNQVMVFFDDRLFQGNRTRKRSASEFEAFTSPLAPPLAMVGTQVRYLHPGAGAPRSGARSRPLIPRFSRKVALVHVTPGFPAAAWSDSFLAQLEGLVLIVFPSGTGPTQDPAFVDLLRRARAMRLPVVIAAEGAAEAPGGGAQPSAYAAGRGLLAEGCIWAGEMTPECAFVKTALCLGSPVDGSASRISSPATGPEKG